MDRAANRSNQTPKSARTSKTLHQLEQRKCTDTGAEYQSADDRNILPCGGVGKLRKTPPMFGVQQNGDISISDDEQTSDKHQYSP